MAQITLIGTTHTVYVNPKYRLRLEGILVNESPNFVSLETSPEVLDFREANLAGFRKVFANMGFPEDESNNFMYALFGENQVAIDYCKKHGVPYEGIDMSSGAGELEEILWSLRRLGREYYMQVRGLIIKNYHISISTGFHDKIWSEGDIKELESQHNTQADIQSKDDVVNRLERDRYMADFVIGKIQNERLPQDFKIVSVNGGGHILDAPGSFYANLKDLNPKRIIC